VTETDRSPSGWGRATNWSRPYPLTWPTSPFLDEALTDRHQGLPHDLLTPDRDHRSETFRRVVAPRGDLRRAELSSITATLGDYFLGSIGGPMISEP
jgi:hypothetical protein